MTLPTRFDLYASRMYPETGPILRRLFGALFGPVRVDPEGVEKIQDLSKRGTVVYCMRTRSQLDFLYFNWLYVCKGLPLPGFVNGIQMRLWQPFSRMLHTTLARLGMRLLKGRIPNPLESGYIEGLARDKESIMIFLGRSTSLLDRLFPELWGPIQALVEAQARCSDPIYLVPQLLVVSRDPSKVRPGLIDVLFGETLEPGRLRRLVSFFRGRRTGRVQWGDPIDLREFIRSRSGESAPVLARKLRWVLRNYIYRESRAITGPRRRPRWRVREKVLRSLEKDIDRLAQENDLSPDEVRRKIDAVVREVAADTRHRWVLMAYRFFYWVWNTMFSGVHFETREMGEFRETMKKAPVVLVSSHKSHLDYLLISYIFFDNALSVPHIAAGKNLSFWPLGFIFRRLGAFFIRRRFRGDPLYVEVFKKYLRQIILDGYPVEFFIEGTRSRTGKVLLPRLGLLQMIVETYLSGKDEDLAIVPIAVTYERVPEDGAHARELSGEPKKAESLLGLFSMHKVLRQRYGRVFIRLGDPIFLKTWFAPFLQEEEATRSQLRESTHQLGLAITNKILEGTVVTPTSLVAAVLLSAPEGEVSREELDWGVSRLLEILEGGAAMIPSDTDPVGPWVDQALGLFSRAGALDERIVGQEERCLLRAEQRLRLAYYRNSVLFLFWNLSLSLRALKSFEGGSLDQEGWFREFEAWSEWLEGQRIFPVPPESEASFRQVLATLTRVAGLEFGEEGVGFTAEGEKVCDLLLGWTSDVVVAHQLVMEYLEDQASGDGGTFGVVSSILEEGRSRARWNSSDRPEAWSRPLLESALIAVNGLDVEDRSRWRRRLHSG